MTALQFLPLFVLAFMGSPAPAPVAPAAVAPDSSVYMVYY